MPTAPGPKRSQRGSGAVCRSTSACAAVAARWTSTQLTSPPYSQVTASGGAARSDDLAAGVALELVAPPTRRSP